MNQPEDYCLVLCTCPDRVSATRLASTLVERRLAACVNQLPGVVSTYTWQDEVRHDEEVLLLIKTTVMAYESVEKTLKAAHPYELPEILAVPLRAGLPKYLSWVSDSIATDIC